MSRFSVEGNPLNIEIQATNNVKLKRESLKKEAARLKKEEKKKRNDEKKKKI